MRKTLPTTTTSPWILSRISRGREKKLVGGFLGRTSLEKMDPMVALCVLGIRRVLEYASLLVDFWSSQYLQLEVEHLTYIDYLGALPRCWIPVWYANKPSVPAASQHNTQILSTIPMPLKPLMSLTRF